MNKHDQRRKDQLIKTLRKAKEQADTMHLYLSADETNMDELERAYVAVEHIELALAHLSREDDGQACRQCGCTEHHPCPEGCWWVEPDLCSACVESAQEEA